MKAMMATRLEVALSSSLPFASMYLITKIIFIMINDLLYVQKVFSIFNSEYSMKMEEDFLDR